MKKAKYLGMVMDEHMTFQNHMDPMKLKLNRANGLLTTLRHYVNPVLLRTIYYAIFEPHLRYGCQLWGKYKHKSYKILKKSKTKP